MSRPASAFDIKSASITGLALALRTADITAIEAELGARVRDAGDLFHNAPVLIDVSALSTDQAADQLALARLVELMSRFTMRAVGIVGADGALLTLALGLGLIEEIAIRPRQRIVAATAVDHAVAGLTAPTLVIDKPLRSGQRVYARGGDLVVLGMVSHGAEVIADGNIHVYGPLRGRAIAGANGDSDARIFATTMQPELISIAGTYRTTDKPLAPDVLGKPAQARLDGERLLIEALKS